MDVDFCVPDEGLAVQACWSLSDASTRERELEALEKLSARFPLKRIVVVTRDERDVVSLSNGQKVEVVPLANWLLETEGAV